MYKTTQALDQFNGPCHLQIVSFEKKILLLFYLRVHVCVPPGIHFALLLVLGWRPLIKLGNISADS
jgi:hypothetical protein